MPVTHSTVVAIPDDPNYPVGSDEWNANHTVSIDLVTEVSGYSRSGSGNSTYTDTSSIVWTGTTAPSGTLTAVYRWQKIGNVCTIFFTFFYSVAGSANSAVTYNMPSDAPTPAVMDGVGDAANEWVMAGNGIVLASPTGAPPNNTKVAIFRNSTDTGFEIRHSFGNTNCTVVQAIIDYPCS